MTRETTDKPLSERSQWDRDLVTLAAMKKHGSSFIKSLGELYKHADRYDRERVNALRKRAPGAVTDEEVGEWLESFDGFPVPK